jgi:hypothetical protein
MLCLIILGTNVVFDYLVLMLCLIILGTNVVFDYLRY